MFERGVEDEVRGALAQPISRTARAVLGLGEVAELPRAEAEAAIVARTRRYAAYQRKWMRRIPGLVTVRADRPAEEVADEFSKWHALGNAYLLVERADRRRSSRSSSGSSATRTRDRVGRRAPGRA